VLTALRDVFAEPRKTWFSAFMPEMRPNYVEKPLKWLIVVSCTLPLDSVLLVLYKAVPDVRFWNLGILLFYIGSIMSTGISLKNHLALTYALFTGLALTLLTLVVNQASGVLFSTLVKRTIAGRSAEIVRTVEDNYDPLMTGFDRAAIEAAGMFFVHEGYIITVEDAGGNPVWNARSCDMEQCAQVIGEITERMEGEFGINGGLRKQRYPVIFSGRTVGFVDVETYGPYFYSGAETGFLASVNRLLLVSGLVFTLLSIIISAVLAEALARPILKAGEAARLIAQGDTSVRIPGDYRTRELQDLSQSLNELAGDLEEGQRRQKQLTQDIAHELRTPLTCLQGTMEAMIDGVYEPDRNRLEDCREEVLRLAKLVEDLNTLTSLEWEGLTLNKTDFDLAKLIRSAAGSFISAARDKGIELRLELKECPVSADYDRLRQVFINLLSNAVMYTDEGEITVRIEEGKKGPEVTVSDTGIGIAREELPRIFERLYRTDKSRNRNSGGIGIGLTIAAAIVRAHGGNICAESSPGRGSVFRVSL
jgi:signal transduction histidine kinase